MENSLQIVLTLLCLAIFGAGVGIGGWALLKRGIKGVIKESDPLRLPADASDASIRARDRSETRAMYERLVRDKLDVIKTAVAMDYSQTELKQLDERLEELVGSDKLKALLSDETRTPELTSELMDADLSNELTRVKAQREELEG